MRRERSVGRSMWGRTMIGTHMAALSSISLADRSRFSIIDS